MALKMLRILIRHANNIGRLKGDFSRGIKRPKANEVRSWTDAEIAAFEKHRTIGTKQRLAFALHLYTGQRRSDVHRMSWDDVTASASQARISKPSAFLIWRLEQISLG
jgi:enterobacteria phage integrase